MVKCRHCLPLHYVLRSRSLCSYNFPWHNYRCFQQQRIFEPNVLALGQFSDMTGMDELAVVILLAGTHCFVF